MREETRSEEIMRKGPGLYKEIGKEAQDLLFGDYNTDTKFTLTTYSPRVKLSSTGLKKGDLFFADVITMLKTEIVSTVVRVDTNSNLYTTVAIREPIPGLNTILYYRIPHRSGKLKLQYLHDYVGINSSIGLTGNPILNFSGVLGNNKLALGGDVSFDPREGAFTKCNFGASCTNSDLIAAFTLNDMGNNLRASYYHIVTPLTDTVIGAEVFHRFSTNTNVITMGAQHSLDPLTTLKARVNNLGKVSALVQHQWRRNSLITISVEVATRAIDKSPKFGFALTFNL